MALTWDEDDPERNQVTRRTLTRQEVEEADFKAYLASSTSESEAETDNDPAKEKRRQQAASRDKLRALLVGAGDDELPEGWGRDGGDKGNVDMEITFTPGLSAREGQDETTLEKYQRKMKEKRKKRKEEVKQNGTEQQADGKDDFFDVNSEDDSKGDTADRLGKKGMRKNRDISRDTIPRPPATPTELALLIAADNPDAEPKHFNMKSVLKAEKSSKRKGKKVKNVENDNEIQEDFAIDVEDDRLKALYEDHTFAIDPSNPQ